ncbi:LANO_0C08746g1_1 [Lachancea nothofagi CBS 11611]|uniref:LANO_0C08746g1_1 n=1 Tax=Lachancea nothofagi CBS 11611 TaxID=1266666 RepID=A0A1G4JA73_9SACH|nr:LANO_0C08746g1_1 [Lachancea nothofagi CBS 11611]
MSGSVIELDDDILWKEAVIPTKNCEQEIFESSDQEITSDDSESEMLLNDDVDAKPSGYQESREVFENQVIENAKADFSGRSDNLNKVSNKTTSGCESVPVKLARIRRELQEIGLLNHDSSLQDTEMAGVDKLLDELDQKFNRETQQIKMRLQKGCDDKSPLDAINCAKLPDLSLDYEGSQQILRLESQVAKLERTLGVFEYNGTKTLTTSINEIFREIKLLRGNKNDLQKFQSKLSSISSEYEETLVARKAEKDLETQRQIRDKLLSPEFKVKALYDSYDVLKKYKKALPHLMARLQSLNNLQLEVGESIGTVKTLDTSINWISDQATQWKQMLEQMDQKLNNAEGRSARNKKEVIEWLKAVEMRIDNIP